MKMFTALMHMYCTAKVDMSEYFRSELIQFMSVMRRAISHDAHISGLVNVR